MLAARLKNIFFILMATQVASVSVAFAFWCCVVMTMVEASPQESFDAVLCLGAAFFVATVGFLFIFYKRIVRFDGAHHSLTSRCRIAAQKVILVVGAASALAGLLFISTRIALIMAGFTVMTMALIGILHWISCHLLHRLYNLPHNKIKVLVLGMNGRTKAFCQVINDTGHLGAEVHGYLDEREMEGAPARYLGTIDDISVILRSQVIDMVSIFLPIRTYYDTIDKIMGICRFYGVTSYIVGNVFAADTLHRVPTSINDFGNMAFSSASIDYVGLAVKRLFDIVCALAGLVILSPLLLAIAIFIKIVSRG
ncbi:MAG: hypothetical protein LIQ31_09005, partial [Planctomycetes bacterium]|nr:hypothetical protein [Planctomycetota bacterium]